MDKKISKLIAFFASLFVLGFCLNAFGGDYLKSKSNRSIKNSAYGEGRDIYSRSATVLYGTVKSFDFDSGELTLSTRDSSEETFYISKSAKLYYKSYKYPKNYEFLKSNLIFGTKVKIVVINSNEVKEIFIMEIPQ